MIPIGGIIMWSGSIVSIPNGWRLCDGTNGTPDLRDKFVVGAGNVYSVNDTGGTTDVYYHFTVTELLILVMIIIMMDKQRK